MSDFNELSYDRMRYLRLKTVPADAYEWEADCFFGYTHSEELAERTVQSCSKALALNPKLDLALAMRASAFNARKKHDLALADILEAITLDPAYYGHYQNRASMYHASSQYHQAIADYTKAIELVPNFADLYDKRGAAYMLVSDHKSAIDDFTLSISLVPTSHIKLKRAQAYNFTKNFRAAIDDYISYIETHLQSPSADAAFAERAGIYYLARKYILSIADYSKAIEIVTGRLESKSSKSDLEALLRYYRSRAGVYVQIREIELADADRVKQGELYNKIQALKPE